MSTIFRPTASQISARFYLSTQQTQRDSAEKNVMIPPKIWVILQRPQWDRLSPGMMLRKRNHPNMVIYLSYFP